MTLKFICPSCQEPVPFFDGLSKLEEEQMGLALCKMLVLTQLNEKNYKATISSVWSAAVAVLGSVKEADMVKREDCEASTSCAKCNIGLSPIAFGVSRSACHRQNFRKKMEDGKCVTYCWYCYMILVAQVETFQVFLNAC